MQLIKLVVVFALFLSIGTDSLFAKTQNPSQNKGQVKKKEMVSKKSGKVAKQNKKNVKPKQNKKLAKNMGKSKLEKKSRKTVNDRKPASVKAKVKKSNKK